MSFFIHIFIGAVTNVTNNFFRFILNKNVIPEINNNNDSLIIGTWNIEGSSEYKTIEDVNLSKLYKIPYESKCTQYNVNSYAYKLGCLISSFYFWKNIHKMFSFKIVFTPNELYTKW